MKYTNYKVDNDLNNYSRFGGKTQSHFTVNTLMIAYIHSTIFFSSHNWEDWKFYTHKYRTNWSSFRFYIKGILKFQMSEQILLKRPSYAPTRLAITEISKYCRSIGGIFQFDFDFLSEKVGTGCSVSESKNLKHGLLKKKYYTNPADLYFCGNRAKKEGNNWIGQISNVGCL